MSWWLLDIPFCYYHVDDVLELTKATLSMLLPTFFLKKPIPKMKTSSSEQKSICKPDLNYHGWIPNKLSMDHGQNI